MLCHPSGPRKQSEDEDHKTPTKLELICMTYYAFYKMRKVKWLNILKLKRNFAVRNDWTSKVFLFCKEKRKNYSLPHVLAVLKLYSKQIL